MMALVGHQSTVCVPEVKNPYKVALSSSKMTLIKYTHFTESKSAQSAMVKSLS